MISVTGLTKHYRRRLAVDDLTFDVAAGRVTGFVGPNGAGKSTTMRVILALDAADEGKATVGGRSYASLRQPMRVIGSLLETAATDVNGQQQVARPHMRCAIGD